jgi:hypothetical protein
MVFLIACVIVASFFCGRSSVVPIQYLTVQPQVMTDEYFESYYLTVNYANGKGFTACFYTPQELNEFLHFEYVKVGHK